ncbi:MAG: DUF3014 domain-containing protein [Acidimicrobiia bacterium]|nr:DUF3014 domain-containing protein [Acidimicrobiia bacterium]
MDDKKPIAVIAVVLTALIGGGAWWYLRPTETPANTSPAAVTATEAPIEKPAPPVNLPPLDQMDDFLRPLLSALSAWPELVRWLATDDLVRQLAFALDHASKGNSPARDFKVIAPRGAFQASGRGVRRTIDPRSYQRYNSLVDTLVSIDASAAARIYKTIKPRLDEAYQGLGNKNRTVDDAMHETLEILFDTPLISDPVDVIETGGSGWAFADQSLEAHAPTQKQLLRMGPANTDRVLVWLRAFQAALQ